MKKVGLIILFIVSFSKANSQIIDARNDTYTVRDTTLDYIIGPLLNDTTSDTIYITSTLPPNNVNAQIIDGKFIHVTDNLTGVQSINIRYVVSDSSGTLDTANILINKVTLPDEVYSGDCNNDGRVNHLDILHIGVNIENYGNPRHNADTNLNFYSKAVGDWTENSNGINLKHSDVDGNGIIDSTDIDGININYNSSHATYNPSLSPSSMTTFISSALNNDTFGTDKTIDSLRIPISIITPNNISSYGIGFSYSIEYLDKNTNNYKSIKHIHRANEPWKNDKLFSISNTIGDTQEIAYCRYDKQNEDIDTFLGIAEIVIDVIDIGIADAGDISEVKLNAFDIVLIDKDYTLIPISPQETKIYLKNTRQPASIHDRDTDKDMLVFPSIVSNGEINISAKKIIKDKIHVYNSLGRKIISEKINSNKTTIKLEGLSSGIYFLKLEKDTKSYQFIIQ